MESRQNMKKVNKFFKKFEKAAPKQVNLSDANLSISAGLIMKIRDPQHYFILSNETPDSVLNTSSHPLCTIMIQGKSVNVNIILSLSHTYR